MHLCLPGITLNTFALEKGVNCGCISLLQVLLYAQSNIVKHSFHLFYLNGADSNTKLQLIVFTF